jgi:hypothetical protein
VAGGADPIPGLGSTNFLGYGDLEETITAPGSLLAWYRFNYDDEGPTGDALDSSGNSRTLTYVENSSPVNADGETWSTANEGIRVAGAHGELGPNDDGVLFLQYDQAHNPGGSEGTWTSKTYPGSWFHRTDSALSHWSTSVKTILGWFKAPVGGNTVIKQTLVASRYWDAAEGGTQGWAINYDPATGILAFRGGASGPADLPAPGGVTVGEWHLFALTLDTSTHVWTLYLDGEVVATMTNTHVPLQNGIVTVGQDSGTYGNFPEGASANAFFHGYMDELAFYSATLTLAQIQAIFAARGDGTGFGPTTTHVYAGTPATPFAISSELGGGPSGTDADAGLELLSDGEGGTYWGVAAAGTTWFTDSGDPGIVTGSKDGDYYVNSDTGEVWKKVSGAWVDQEFSLVPPVPRFIGYRWAGLLPIAIGQGIIWETPYAPDGSSLAFTLKLAIARLEVPVIGDTSFLLQKAAGGDVAFGLPSTITTVTVSAGHYRGVQSGLSFAVNSGDLVGLNFSALGAGTEPPCSIYLYGEST